MYEEDGTNMRATFIHPDGGKFVLVVDDEAYAHLLNEGWSLDDTQEAREIVREEIPGMFPDGPPIGRFSDADIHA